MKPIEIIIFGSVQKTSQEICSIILDTNYWSEFKGYFILPGIRSAQFEIRTPSVVGSRIKVQNNDGSSHVEEIIEWNISNKVVLKFQEFDSPLKYFATHFIEVWNFSDSNNGTKIIRTMTLYHKGVIGWLILKPISQLMKKALEKNLTQLIIE